MADERGISEGNLVEEIIELWKDVRMYRDQIHSYDNGSGNIDYGDAKSVDISYFKHILCLDKIRLLTTMGRKYFPHSNINWDEYGTTEGQRSLSFGSEDIRDILIGECKCYAVTSADDGFLGLR